MKKTIITALSTAFILFSCDQKKETISTEKTDSVKVEKTTITATKPADSLTKEQKKELAKKELASLPKPYHPEDNADAKIAEAVKTAKSQHKNVMIQVGGNWCIWCLRFNNFVQTTPELKSLVDKNFVYYHLNFSPEQKNEEVLKKYGNPGEKFGYPVFIVLDENGKQIHTQDSAVLEDGKGYSIQKVKDFFEKFAPKS